MAHNEPHHRDLHCLSSSLWILKLNMIYLGLNIFWKFAYKNFVVCFLVVKELKSFPPLVGRNMDNRRFQNTYSRIQYLTCLSKQMLYMINTPIKYTWLLPAFGTKAVEDDRLNYLTLTKTATTYHPQNNGLIECDISSTLFWAILSCLVTSEHSAFSFGSDSSIERSMP